MAVNFIELNNKYGYDEGMIERFAELAALKSMPVFNTFGLNYGDRVPGLYKIVEDLQEQVGRALEAEGECESQSGWFVVSKKEDYEPGVYELNISLSLETMNTLQLKS